ncbi:ATP-binding protein [Kribbella sp. CA-294648]|uniref:sensor histidine kinase n=1 Tax=Kribbella sp. CA-294648 TaxID=3239948 RepID=UPI003D93472D
MSGLSTAPSASLRRLGDKPRLVDGVLGLLATLLCAIDLLVVGGNDQWWSADRWAVLLVGLAPATLAVHRRWPLLPAPAIALACVLAYPVVERAWILIACLAIALFLLAIDRPPLYAGAVAALALLIPPTVALVNWSRISDLVGLLPGIEGPGWWFLGYSQNREPLYEDPFAWSSAEWLYPLLIGAWLLGLAWKRLPGLPAMLRPVKDFVTNPANQLWLDGVLAAAFVAAMVYDLSNQRAGDWEGVKGWVVLLACAVPASLTVRRAIPEIPAVALGLAGLLAYPLTQTHWVLTPALAVALYSLAVWRPWLQSVLVAAGGLVALPVLSWAIQGKPVVRLLMTNGWTELSDLQRDALVGRSWPVWLSALMLAAWSVGLLVRLARENRLAAAREADLVKQNQEREQVQVLLEGRSQIARDLHDVVAHHVNLIVIQAETGPDLVQRDEQDVLQGFQRIGDAGRKALGELDRMLSALRDAHGVPDPSLTPQPGLADLRPLTEGLSDQGLPVSLEVTGDLEQIPDGVQLTAYRLVQEALTNVVKHARADAVQVMVDGGGDGLEVCITDNGRGFDPDSPPDGRHGLTGMRERVRVHDGTLTITSHPGTGTTITALLPHSEAKAKA